MRAPGGRKLPETSALIFSRRRRSGSSSFGRRRRRRRRRRRAGRRGTRRAPPHEALPGGGPRPPRAGGRAPPDLRRLEKIKTEAFRSFRPPGPSAGPRSVKNRPRTKNRSRGMGPDLWVPTLQKNATSGVRDWGGACHGRGRGISPKFMAPLLFPSMRSPAPSPRACTGPRATIC